MKRNDILKLAAIAILLSVVYSSAFAWMYTRWSARDTYYSHGFLVPFISGFLVWQKRKLLSGIIVKPSPLGWSWLGGALLLQMVGTLWNIGFVSGISFILAIIGLVQILLGKDYLREVILPILFLGFMVPLPEVVIVNFSFRLKLFAAQISTFIVNHLGVPAIREGSVIKTLHSTLMVEDPCSGIRSLVALIALGALMSYFSNLSKIKKIALFISALPIAIASNIVRIVALTMISEIYGEQYAGGLVHDTLGILTFVFAFAGLALVSKLLE